MKKTSLGLVGCVLFALGGFAQQNQSYTINIEPCYNLIANQLDQGNNTLNAIMPSVPDGCVLEIYDNSSLTWSTAYFDASIPSWVPANLTLNPGQGAWFLSSTSFPLTFTGTPNVPVLPVTIPNGGVYLLSRQTNDIGNYTNIVGTTPPMHAKVFEWDPSAQAYVTYTYGAIGWVPSEPMVPVGASVWIAPQGGSPPSPPPSSPIVVCATTNKTVACGANWSFDAPKVIDPCCTNYNLVFSSVTNSGPCPLIITGTWLVTDACGASNSCSQTVTVPCASNCCLSVSNQQFTGVTNAPGNINYSFSLENNALVPARYLLLLPLTNCFAVSPDIVTFQPPLQPGQTANVSVNLAISGNCPSNLCVLMSLEDSNFVNCCSQEICFQPDTNALTIQCPAPVTICGPTNGASATLAVQISNPAGVPLTIQWLVDGTLVQIGGLTLTRNFAIGAHTVEVTASDGQSLVSCSTSVTVQLQPDIIIRLLNPQQVVITWNGGGTLQSATTVGGPYSNVAGATSPYTNQINGMAMFYRVPCP